MKWSSGRLVCFFFNEFKTKVYVGDNRSAWAICGKTRGTLSLESGKMKEVHVDLMPLFQGSLRLPQIRLRPFHQSEHDSSISSIDSPILKSETQFWWNMRSNVHQVLLTLATNSKMAMSSYSIHWIKLSTLMCQAEFLYYHRPITETCQSFIASQLFSQFQVQAVLQHTRDRTLNASAPIQ